MRPRKLARAVGLGAELLEAGWLPARAAARAMNMTTRELEHAAREGRVRCRGVSGGPGGRLLYEVSVIK